jgi:N-acetylmuramoyl-L-alanine amidase CwlA
MVEFQELLLTPRAVVQKEIPWTRYGDPTGRGRPGTRLQVISGIVVHWTANFARTANAIANRNYFEYQVDNEVNGSPRHVSSHYIVDDSKIIRCVPEEEVTYHVGANYSPELQRIVGMRPNNTTISIEWCVNAGSNGGATYQNVVALIADICVRRQLTDKQVWRHFDFTGKDCPGFFVSDQIATNLGFVLPPGGAHALWHQFLRDVRVATRARYVMQIMR